MTALGQYSIRTWNELREEIEDGFGDAISMAGTMIAMQKRKKKCNEITTEYIQITKN